MIYRGTQRPKSNYSTLGQFFTRCRIPFPAHSECRRIALKSKNAQDKLRRVSGEVGEHDSSRFTSLRLRL